MAQESTRQQDVLTPSSQEGQKAEGPLESQRRWYDHDPMLAEVLEMLRAYPAEMQIQAESFLKRIEEQIGAEAMERFYAVAQPPKTGNRWYDHDPQLFRAIELLRVVPPAVQRQAASRFLEAMKNQGLGL